MKNFKKEFSFIALLLFVVVFCSNSFGQRNLSYQDLALKTQQPQSSFDFITLPADENDQVQFAVIFHIPYKSLPFKKNKERIPDKAYFSSMDLMLEVFESEKTSTKELRRQDISLKGFDPVGRAFWTDTVYAKDYDSTQLRDKFLGGFLKVNLEPGTYNYIMQMKRGAQTESQISRVRQVTVSSYKEKDVGNIMVSPLPLQKMDGDRFILNNSKNMVPYAKDFTAMAYLPQYQSGETYSLEVAKLNTLREDTTREDIVYRHELTNNDLKTNIRPQLQTKNGTPYLSLVQSRNGYTYALLEIPNSRFENSLYQITIKNSNGDVVASDNFRSQWKDMPTSLLNLDVAIEMLHFIVDKETLKRINSGSAAERERKFRSFWDERDPTPKTEFNELMAEYYRRIDYAYENFSTENMIGYESDRGEIYIKFGPPSDINRKFPTSGATTEIWTYPNRKFIFEATTGFGDFKLISKQSR